MSHPSFIYLNMSSILTHLEAAFDKSSFIHLSEHVIYLTHLEAALMSHPSFIYLNMSSILTHLEAALDKSSFIHLS